MIVVLAGQLFISAVAAREAQVCVTIKRGHVITTVVIVVFDNLFTLLDCDGSSCSFNAVTFLSLSFSLASVGNA